MIFICSIYFENFLQLLFQEHILLALIYQQIQVKISKMDKTEQSTITIKIQHNQTLFNLGKNIKTFDDLIGQITVRFPQTKKQFQLFVDKKTLQKQNFHQLIQQKLAAQEKSLKIILKEVYYIQNSKEQEKIMLLSDKSPSSKSYSFNANDIDEKQSSSKKYSFDPTEHESKKYSFDPKDFEDQASKPDLKDQMKSQLKNKIIQEKQLKIKEAEENFIEPDKIKIKVFFEQKSNYLKIQPGVEYFWSCTLINQGEFAVPIIVFVRDLTTHKLIEIDGLKINEAKQIKFGPYSQDQAGKYSHFYQLIYKKNDEIRYPIGGKFGFVSQVPKTLETKALQNKFYQRINELRNFSACQKSTKNLIMKLKEMQITEQVIDQYEDQELIEMFQSFNLE